MTTLYELADQYKQALNDLTRDDLGLDEETIADTLEGLEGEVNDKLEAVAMHLQNLDASAKLKKKRAKELSDQAAVLSSRVDKLANYLDVNFKKLGKDKLPCKYFDIKLRKLPDSVQVNDINLVAREFLRSVESISVDKNAAKKAMQDGMEIDGLTLITNAKKVVLV